MTDRTVLILGFLILAMLVIATHRRNQIWQSREALWLDAAAQSPLKLRPLVNAGFALRLSGKRSQAASYFQAAMRLEPHGGYDREIQSAAETNLGNMAMEDGDYPASRILLSDAMQRFPTLETANSISEWMLASGYPESAIDLTGQILEESDRRGQSWRLRPSLWSVRGQAFQRIGNCQEAMAAYVAIKYLEPDFQIPACP